MFCALSGEVPTDPVVSPKSGRVFERRLVHNYIVSYGTDPISGDVLRDDDLIPLHVADKSTAPRLPSATSVPQLLTALQDAWDASAVEVFELRRDYQSAVEQLSAALYQVDAAKRVIARLVTERDEARDALAKALK